MILSNEAQFVIEIPADFDYRLVHGEKPAVLIVADATDPTATVGAIAAATGAVSGALDRELTGPLASLAQNAAPFELRVQRRYNAAGEARRNIVPGLIGTILTMTMLIFTSISVTKEIERGTMETLLAMPVNPVEIMLGKILPYVVVGAVQMAIVLVVATFLFHVPIVGSLMTLIPLTLLFITANLAIGYTFSTIASNQVQAFQMSFMFFLPSMLLSGFLFPFRGMPQLGAGPRLDPAAHPLSARRALGDAEGLGLLRAFRRHMAAGAVRAGRDEPSRSGGSGRRWTEGAVGAPDEICVRMPWRGSLAPPLGCVRLKSC